jgi:PAS domain S-box-containing protein
MGAIFIGGGLWLSSTVRQKTRELIQVNKVLRENESQLANSIESMPTAYIMWNTDNQIVEWNKAAEKIFGYSKEEILGRNAVDYIVPEKIRRLVGNVLKDLKIGQIAEYSERDNNIRKDGTLISCEWYNTLLADPTGNIYGFITLAQEITERLKTEEDLQISEERFRSVAETAADAIISIDSQSKIIYWNRSAQAYFGYSADEIIGELIHTIIPKNFQKDHHEGMKRILAGGESKIIGKTIEVMGLKKNETQFPMELSLAKWKTGDELYFTAIIRDISKRKENENILKENEEKFRSLFEYSPLAIVHLDKYGVITASNENLCKMLGSTKDELIGQDTTTTVKDVMMLNAITKALSGQTSLYEGEYVSAIRGVHTQVRAIYAAIQSDDGNITGVIGILEDITEQVAAKQHGLELESQLRQLQKNEAIGALAGGIAHDFNNILFPIIGYAEMLKDDLDENSQLHENVDVILAGAMRAKDLVRQILTFSRQVEEKSQPLKPHFIINEVMKLIRATTPSSIKIKKSIDPNTFLIMADPTQIHQVAMNLISNANYAMRENGGTLTIRLQNIEGTNIPDRHFKLGDDPHMLLSIGDTGSGMDDTTLEKIFNPYFTSKPKGEGTGLGLSVVYGIIKNYGGDISVKSSIGKGTIFNIYIPALIKEKAVKLVQVSVANIRGEERILFVDDEKQVLRTGQKILERLGYKVEPCDSSLDALEKINANPDAYDLVISDMAMPNLTGDQLTQKILKIKPTMPIVICTGFSERISLENVISIGAKALLMKPIIKSKLATTIRETLDKAKEDIKSN